MARPGGGIVRLEAAAAAAARAGEVNPKAVDRVAAAVASVGLSNAESPATNLNINTLEKALSSD